MSMQRRVLGLLATGLLTLAMWEVWNRVLPLAKGTFLADYRYVLQVLAVFISLSLIHSLLKRIPKLGLN